MASQLILSLQVSPEGFTHPQGLQKVQVWFLNAKISELEGAKNGTGARTSGWVYVVPTAPSSEEVMALQDVRQVEDAAAWNVLDFLYS